ncbi:hypothetical protein GCM10023196_055760 [Actinoallomurus vinaceus]|uniref:Uncharacterized protein n=1 Tax=Actinoallomurus vinaceus TaxID=1080074 RepID=A0ABP8UI11_9ACTN
MQKTARMAGFLAAHGIWSVSDGEALIPLFGYQDTNGDRAMDRLVFDDIADAAKAGQEALRTGREDWVGAVLVADGYLRSDARRIDALIIDVVEYLPTRQSMRMAIPYRPQPQGFAVYRPKFLEVPGRYESDQSGLAESFFAGVDSHEQAAAVWDAHLIDQSV